MNHQRTLYLSSVSIPFVLLATSICSQELLEDSKYQLILLYQLIHNSSLKNYAAPNIVNLFKIESRKPYLYVCFDSANKTI